MMLRKLVLTFSLIVLVLINLACDAPPAPFGRLVDLPQRIGAVSEPESLQVRAPVESFTRESGSSTFPTGTIDNDTRFVLAGHPYHVVAERVGVVTTDPDVVRYEKSMDGFFPGAEYLLIDVRTFVLGGGEWESRQPMLRRLSELGDEQALELELDMEGTPAGTLVKLWVEAYQAPPIGGTRYVSPARKILRGSRLEFAFGIMEAAVSQGRVRFSVSACKRDDCELLFTEVLDPVLKNRSGWQERDISLSPVWGETRTLKFEAVPERAEALSLPLWADPRVVIGDPGSSRPNVIVLSIDTLRRDHLSVYGYERETSPFIEGYLATNGAVFDNLISEAATTESSHMSIFTSLPALVHGSTSYGTGLGVPVMTLADAFRAQGYDTAAFTEGGPLAHELGFGIGFDRWVENPSLHFLFPKGQVDRVFAQAWDWIGQRRNRPFFVFLHTFQVHHPLSPPPSYRHYFLETDEGDDKGKEPTKEHLDVARYDQEIRYVDDQLELFWTKLEDRGIAQNSILVLVSDHGDEFWEHGERGHASLPYEEVLNVPLVMIGPMVAKGLRSDRPLHHLDLMPTILDLVDIPVPEHVLGQSFADSVRGTGSMTENSKVSRVRTSASWWVPAKVGIPVFAIRDETLKVIRYEKGEKTYFECFDLEDDPGEKTNLCARKTTEHADLLLKHLETYESEMESIRLSLGGKRADDDSAEEAPLSPEQEEQLRVLGYVE